MEENIRDEVRCDLRPKCRDSQWTGTRETLVKRAPERAPETVNEKESRKVTGSDRIPTGQTRRRDRDEDL